MTQFIFGDHQQNSRISWTFQVAENHIIGS